MNFHRLALTGLALILVLPASTSLARGQLQAGPTLLEIASGGQATRLRLRNTGTGPVAAQVRVYAWSQDQGEDRLLPTDDLVVSPPIVDLPGGSERIVRLVLVGPAASERDHNYRVVVDELPDDRADVQNHVALRMRYVIPMHVRAARADEPALQCRVDTGRSRLRCDNHGGRAAQLGATGIRTSDGRRLELSPGLFGYVLPGTWRSWPLPDEGDGLPGHALHLETWVNGRLVALPLAHTP